MGIYQKFRVLTKNVWNKKNIKLTETKSFCILKLLKLFISFCKNKKFKSNIWVIIDWLDMSVLFSSQKMFNWNSNQSSLLHDSQIIYIYSYHSNNCRYKRLQFYSSSRATTLSSLYKHVILSQENPTMAFRRPSVNTGIILLEKYIHLSQFLSIFRQFNTISVYWSPL